MDGTSQCIASTSCRAFGLPPDFIAGLEASTITDLERELVPTKAAPGDVLLGQGEAGDGLHVLIAGRIRVLLQAPGAATPLVEEITAPATIGELAVVPGQTYTATVRALTDCELLTLPTAAYRRLAARHPVLMTQLLRQASSRLQRSQLLGVLTSAFGSLSTPAVEAIQTRLRLHQLSAGAALFTQDDPGDALYLVLTGRLRIVVATADGGERVLGEVGGGECVGEWALMTGQPRTATVRAIRDTELARLSQADFDDLVVQYPQVMTQITRMIITRQQRIVASAHRQTPPTSFAIVPLDRAVPFKAFAQQLTAALTSYGPTLFVDRAVCEGAVGIPLSTEIGEEHPLRGAFVRWLNEQETVYRSIVYLADPEWSPWTAQCVRQADRVLLVADAMGDSARGEIDERMTHMPVPVQTELVLLHAPTVKRPLHTRQWLARRELAAHHHVRVDEHTHVQRLARKLTGRALGLVLGGGGARGFAHIGVLRALEESGLSVDYIGGTSMGALVGACYAAGMTPEAITTASKRFGAPKALFDYTVPLVSLFTSKKLTHTLDVLFDDVQIEDLWHPFFSVSSNLTQAKPVVHQSGPLRHAVRASVAIPGVFSPVLANGELLVDGGVLNNLPVEYMRDVVVNGTVIAVNVAPAHDPIKHYAFDTSVSGWQVLWHKINPFSRAMPVPSIFSTLLRSSALTSISQQETKRRLSDLFVTPPVEPFSLMNFQPVEAIAAVGYQATRQALVGWRGNRS